MELQRRQSKAVELRLIAIGARGQDYRTERALQDGGRLSMGKERQRLVEHVTGLDVGEDQTVGLAVDGRDDTLAPHVVD